MGENTVNENGCVTTLENPDGFHEPDWNTVSVSYDGGALYIDVTCHHCGVSGCIGTDATLAEMIDW